MRSNTPLLVVSLLCICTGLVLAQSHVDTHLQNAVDDLKQFLKNQKQIDKGFDRIFYDVYIISTLNPKSKIFTQEECQLIQETDTVTLQVKELYFYMKLKQIQNKCQLQTPDNIIERLRNLQNDDNFATFYFAVSGLLLVDVKENVEDSCQKLSDFILPDGTGKIHSKKPDSTYLYGGILLEMVHQCQTLYQEKSVKAFDDAKVGIDNALATLYELFPGQLGWLEFGNTIESVAKMVHGIETLLPQNDPLYKKFRSTYFYGLLNYLRDQNTQILTPKQRFFLVEVFKKLENEPLFTVKRGSVVTTQTNTEILYRYENLFGDQIINVNQTLVAQLYFNDQPIYKVNTTKVNQQSEEWNFLFEIPTKEIQQFGYYTLKVNSLSPIEAIIENKVLITTRVKVPEIEFEILEGKGSIPISFENKAKTGETLEKLLKATEHSQIHFRFKLEFDRNQQFGPNLVAIRLKHPSFKTTNNMAFAKYDETKGIYKVLLDLGDTDITLAYSDQYEVELIIADPRLKENIRWSFAQLDITFSRVRKDSPPNDADYSPATIIEHSFPAPRPDIPTHFVFFFSALIVAAFIFFIKSLASLGVNFNKIPVSADGKLSVLLFIGALIVLLLLLVVFWVQINLVQTMYILLFITIPLFLIGNKALTALKDSEKAK